MTIPSGSDAENTKVAGWQDQSDNIGRFGQEWIFIPVDKEKSPSLYMLRNLRGGTCLDLWGGSSANGTHVSGFLKHGRANQQWKVIPAEEYGYFRYVIICLS